MCTSGTSISDNNHDKGKTKALGGYPTPDPSLADVQIAIVLTILRRGGLKTLKSVAKPRNQPSCRPSRRTARLTDRLHQRLNQLEIHSPPMSIGLQVKDEQNWRELGSEQERTETRVVDKEPRSEGRSRDHTHTNTLRNKEIKKFNLF